MMSLGKQDSEGEFTAGTVAAFIVIDWKNFNRKWSETTYFSQWIGITRSPVLVIRFVYIFLIQIGLSVFCFDYID